MHFSGSSAVSVGGADVGRVVCAVAGGEGTRSWGAGLHGRRGRPSGRPFLSVAASALGRTGSRWSGPYASLVLLWPIGHKFEAI